MITEKDQTGMELVDPIRLGPFSSKNVKFWIFKAKKILRNKIIGLQVSLKKMLNTNWKNSGVIFGKISTCKL